jgi:hypothetical protein
MNNAHPSLAAAIAAERAKQKRSPSRTVLDAADMAGLMSAGASAVVRFEQFYANTEPMALPTEPMPLQRA